MAAAAFAYRAKQNSSSDSDSNDSDQECCDWKRATRRTEDVLEKIPIETSPVETPLNPSPEGDKPATSKRKRNNIWCDVLEDQILSETLNHCGVKQKPKGYGSRGEESYDYTLARKYHRKDEDLESEGSEEEMSDSTETSSVVSHRGKRFSNPSFVKLDGAGKDAAKKIIKTLGEQKQYLIYRIVKFLGIEKAMKLLKMTEDIEENGGMMIKNNARRRTPGGVYFQLLRTEKDIEQSAIDKIFEGEMNSFQVKRLFEERRKQKKKYAAAMKAALKAKELPLPITFPQPQIKAEETTKMEEDSILMEEEPPILKDIATNNKIAQGSDLEDGEIDD